MLNIIDWFFTGDLFFFNQVQENEIEKGFRNNLRAKLEIFEHGCQFLKNDGYFLKSIWLDVLAVHFVNRLQL